MNYQKTIDNYLDLNMLRRCVNLKLPIIFPVGCLKANDVKINGVVIMNWTLPFDINCAIFLAREIIDNRLRWCADIGALKNRCRCISIVARCDGYNDDFVFSVWP